MDYRDIISSLQGVAADLLPRLATAGIPGASLASAALEIAQTVQSALDQHKEIGTMTSQAQLDAVIDRLKAHGNDLARQIDES